MKFKLIIIVKKKKKNILKDMSKYKENKDSIRLRDRTRLHVTL